MRKVLAVVALVLVVGAAALVGKASSTLKREALAALAAAREAVARKADVAVDGGEVAISVFPSPTVAIDGLRVVTKKDRQAVAEGGTLRVALERGALWRGRWVPERVTAAGYTLVVAQREASARELLATVLDAGVPVAFEDCTVRFDRGTEQPHYDLASIDVVLTAANGAVSFKGRMAPLGAASQSELEGEWRPRTGRTGGDALRLRLGMKDGEAAALETLVPALATETIRGGIRLEVEGEGWIGERSTEARPAEPLKGRVKAETELEIFGLRRPVVFESGFALDDKRWALDNGNVRWGQRSLTYSGWIERALTANRLNLRFVGERIKVADVLADYGIAPRWRPDAEVSGDLRITGSLHEHFQRYLLSAESVRFEGWPGLPVVAGPTTVRGMLAAINAEVSASFSGKSLKLGNLDIEDPSIGVNWWRDKLDVVSLGRPYWGGKVDVAAHYEPATPGEAGGGALLRSVDSAVMLKELFPDVRTTVNGRFDASIEAHFDASGFWYESRFRLFRGSVGQGVLRSLVEAVSHAAGKESALDAALVAAHPGLAENSTPFARLDGAFQVKQGRIGVEIAKLSSDDGEIRALGSLSGRALDAAAIATLAPPLADALAARIPVLAKLRAADGALAVAFRLAGPLDEPAVTLAPSFTEALAKAAAATSPQPFVPAPLEPLPVAVAQLDEVL